MSKYFAGSYVPKYHEDYFKLPWYERDMMTYIDWSKYMDMADNPDFYMKNKEVINFDMIHHKYHGYKLKGTINSYKTIKDEDFKNYPKDKKNMFCLQLFSSNMDDLWVKRNSMIQHF